MAASKVVNILAPNGRRQIVRVSPDTTILQILEEVCQKQGYVSEEYELRHHNKVLDTTLTVRYSGLPNNAQLEMRTAQYARKESEVIVCLQLESGERVMGKFYPGDTLWAVVNSLCPHDADPMSNPVVIFMRKEIYGVVELNKITLRSLGITSGRALLRYVHKTPEELHRQANVSMPLNRPMPAVGKEFCNKSQKNVERYSAIENIPQGIYNPPSLHSSQPTTSFHMPNAMSEVRSTAVHVSFKEEKMEVSDINTRDAHSEAISIPSSENLSDEISLDNSSLVDKVIYLGERNAIVFDLKIPSSIGYGDLPDEFFNLTVKDAQNLLRDLRKKREELENEALVTSAHRALEAEKRTLSFLNQYKVAVLRIQFPDRTVLQGAFKPVESVATVESFVRQYLRHPHHNFYLYMTPPKKILDSDLRLVEVDCVPSALLHFDYENRNLSEDMRINKKSFLSPDVLNRCSSLSGATLAASQTRGINVVPSSIFDEPTAQALMDDDAGPSTRYLNNTVSSPDYSQNLNPNLNSNSKVPKWFKPTKSHK